MVGRPRLAHFSTEAIEDWRAIVRWLIDAAPDSPRVEAWRARVDELTAELTRRTAPCAWKPDRSVGKN